MTSLKISLLLATLTFTVAAQSGLRILAVDEAPANYLDKAGQPTGYVTDIVSAISSQLELDLAIEFVPEARSLSILEHEKNVVLFSISQTPERIGKYLWVGKVLEKSSYIYTLRRRHLQFENISQLADLGIIGVVRGDIREQWLLDAGLTNLQSVTHHKQNLGLLLKQRVDAIAFEDIGLYRLLKNRQIPYQTVVPSYLIRSSSVYIVMSKTSDLAIFNQWQIAFQNMKLNGELSTISHKWQDFINKEVGVIPQIKEDILVF